MQERVSRLLIENERKYVVFICNNIIYGKMEIIFITSSPLHKMHFVDMYIHEIEKEFKTEIWDVSSIYNHKGTSEFSQVKKIETMEALESLVEEKCINEKLVVITNILIYDLHVIYRIFHKRKIPLITIDKEAMAFWLKDCYERKHFKELSFSDQKRIVIKSVPVLRQIYSFLEYQHVKFDYVLGKYNYYPDSSRHFFRIHSLKYDELKKVSESPRLVEGRYILFMDAGLAHHPSHEGAKNAVSKEEYLEAMNAFLDRVEQKFLMPVIVASHPKSNYDENDFNGRKIVLYKTSELLKYADIILAHYSTSLIEAVLQKKRIVFLYSKKYMDSDSKTLMENTIEYASMLNASLVDINDENNISIKFDQKSYEKFTNKFLRYKRKEKYSNSEMIVKFLKKKFDKE